jgi:putative toxin-antitoxin system antitoxin component (TIGR02293 family)
MEKSKVLQTQATAARAATAASDALAQSQIGSGMTTEVDGSHSVHLDPQARIALIRRGLPASMVSDLSSRMGMSKELLLSSLGLAPAAISRKEKDAAVLSKDESERLLGVENLITLAQTMVNESGDPTGFDAARWVSDWLSKPLPALAGATPASYMDTFEGQKLVAELLSMSQSGAYA